MKFSVLHCSFYFISVYNLKTGSKFDFGLQYNSILGIRISLVIFKAYSIEKEMATHFSSVLLYDIASFMGSKSMLFCRSKKQKIKWKLH